MGWKKPFTIVKTEKILISCFLTLVIISNIFTFLNIIRNMALMPRHLYSIKAWSKFVCTELQEIKEANGT